MMTRSKGRQARYWAIQVCHIQDPPPTSPAQLVMMAKHFVSLDKSIYTEFRMHKIRNKWMKLQMKTPDELGGLTCAHCGRKGLQPFDAPVEDRAVLDHKIEIAAGGDWRDPSNFQVLCDRCNGKKNDAFQKNRYATTSKRTASLDRIDSTRGYVVGNLQWIHKDLNLMKNTLPTSLFIEWCKKVSNYSSSS